jgi:RES domain-containing protein
MRVWRLERARHVPSVLAGEGARQFGGRWNSEGVPLVYTSSVASLTILEKLVYVSPGEVPGDLVLLAIDLPSAWRITEWTSAELPADWSEFPAPRTLREQGDTWVASNSTPALRVPGAPCREDSNVLLNPRYPNMAESCTVTAIRPFRFDQRLLRDEPKPR